MDWTDCPLVEINPRKLSGVPVLKGTRMQADSILETYQSGLGVDEIAEVSELPAYSVRARLAYAARHRLHRLYSEFYKAVSASRRSPLLWRTKRSRCD